MKFRWWNPPLRCPQCRARIERPYFVRESIFETCGSCKTELYLKYLPRHEYWEVHDLQLDAKAEIASIAGIKIYKRNILAASAACLSLLIVGGFLWAGLTVQEEKPSQIDPAPNVINPGLFLQCNRCGESIYNVTKKQACAIMRNSKMSCPFCESRDVAVKAKCPKCGRIYDVKMNKVENLASPAWFVEAVCPGCEYQFISEMVKQKSLDR